MEQKIRTMPHNTDAEKCILGSILIDNELGKEIIPEVKSEDFYLTSHKDIFGKIAELYYANKEVDLVTLADKLEQANILDAVGGVEYLAEISDYLPSAANYKFYLEIVKRDSTRRRLIRESQQIIQDSFETEDAKELIAKAEKNIFDLAVTDRRSKPTLVGETISEVLSNFDDYAKNKGKLKGITTGFRDLDIMLNGLNRSDLILVAARPAAGKTSFAMNLVENAAIAGYNCAVFSLEMPKVQISQRILCSNAEVSMSRALKGELTKQEWERLLEAQTRLADVNIFVDDTPSITPADIQSKARSLKTQYGLDLIMIDYIQLMNSGNTKKDQNRQLEIAEISRSLKLIAREIDVPVVALSQLSRQIENRELHIPQLSDLRDSGAIEQDADIIMFIHNPSTENKQEGGAISGGGNGNGRQIRIAKHRNGSIGNVDLGWIGEYTKFVNVQTMGSERYVPQQKEVDLAEEERLQTQRAYMEAEREKRANLVEEEYVAPSGNGEGGSMAEFAPPPDGYEMGDFTMQAPPSEPPIEEDLSDILGF